MGSFVIPYRVLFHDIMAHGSHHFLTDFNLQFKAREQMFFDVVDASQEARAAYEDTMLPDPANRGKAAVALVRRAGIGREGEAGA
jgi:hypothetical protein